MLHRISIENFYSIAECQTIDLTVGAGASDFPCFKTPHGSHDKRLPVAVGVFGPNAAGKSVFLRAITNCRDFNRFSVKNKEVISFLFQPHANDDWQDKPTKIAIDFDCLLPGEQSCLFRYELHIIGDTKKVTTVAYEALSYAPNKKMQRLFARNKQDFKFGRQFKVDKRLSQFIRSDASVINTLAEFNHEISMSLIHSLLSFHTNITGFFRNERRAGDVIKDYINDPELLAALNRECGRFDLGLESIRVENRDGNNIAMFEHIGLTSPLHHIQESFGTQRFMEIFPLLHYALQNGGIAVIDELDVHIHPLLLPEILGWFMDENKNQRNAQLIFSGHNHLIFDYLEKEQILLCEKINSKTTIYSARDIKGLRREPDLLKKYLSGRLGAIPNIG